MSSDGRHVVQSVGLAFGGKKGRHNVEGAYKGMHAIQLKDTVLNASLTHLQKGLEDATKNPFVDEFCLPRFPEEFCMQTGVPFDSTMRREMLKYVTDDMNEELDISGEDEDQASEQGSSSGSSEDAGEEEVLGEEDIIQQPVLSVGGDEDKEISVLAEQDENEADLANAEILSTDQNEPGTSTINIAAPPGESRPSEAGSYESVSSDGSRVAQDQHITLRQPGGHGQQQQGPAAVDQEAQLVDQELPLNPISEDDEEDFDSGENEGSRSAGPVLSEDRTPGTPVRNGTSKSGAQELAAGQEPLRGGSQPAREEARRGVFKRAAAPSSPRVVAEEVRSSSRPRGGSKVLSSPRSGGAPGPGEENRNGNEQVDISNPEDEDDDDLISVDEDENVVDLNAQIEQAASSSKRRSAARQDVGQGRREVQLVEHDRQKNEDQQEQRMSVSDSGHGIKGPQADDDEDNIISPSFSQNDNTDNNSAGAGHQQEGVLAQQLQPEVVSRAVSHRLVTPGLTTGSPPGAGGTTQLHPSQPMNVMPNYQPSEEEVSAGLAPVQFYHEIRMSQDPKYPEKTIMKCRVAADRVLVFETGHIARQANGAAFCGMGGTFVLGTATASGATSGAGDSNFSNLTVEYKERSSALGKTLVKDRAGNRNAQFLENHELLVSRLTESPFRQRLALWWKQETQVLLTCLSADKDHLPQPLALNAGACALWLSDIPMDEPVAGCLVAGFYRPMVEGELETLSDIEKQSMGKWEQNMKMEFILFPSYEEKKNADLVVYCVGTKTALQVLEVNADFCTEAELVYAMTLAQNSITFLCHSFLKLGERKGKKKQEQPSISALTMDSDEMLLQTLVGQMRLKNLKVITEHYFLNHLSKHKPTKHLALLDELFKLHIRPAWLHAFPESLIQKAFELVCGEAMAAYVKLTRKRICGRQIHEVREVSMDLKYLPGPHGSAVFTNGDTQTFATTTLADSSGMLRIENGPLQDGGGVNNANPNATAQQQFGGSSSSSSSSSSSTARRFYMQCSYPAMISSSDAAKRMLNSTTTRETKQKNQKREIGHGNFAERALKPSLPDEEEFPYTIRVESFITENCGGTSMASVCGGSLALADAGVPVKTPIASVKLGLLDAGKIDFAKLVEMDRANYNSSSLSPSLFNPEFPLPAYFVGEEAQIILTDVTDLEKYLGLMDLKVAGSRTGISAVQLDAKNSGVDINCLSAALFQAKAARLHLLDEMSIAITDQAPPAGTLADHVPKLIRFKIPAECKGRVIGPGGSNLRKLEQEFDLITLNFMDQNAEVINVEILGRSEEMVETAKLVILDACRSANVDSVNERGGGGDQQQHLQGGQHQHFHDQDDVPNARIQTIGGHRDYLQKQQSLQESLLRGTTVRSPTASMIKGGGLLPPGGGRASLGQAVVVDENYNEQQGTRNVDMEVDENQPGAASVHLLNKHKNSSSSKSRNMSTFFNNSMMNQQQHQNVEILQFEIPPSLRNTVLGRGGATARQIVEDFHLEDLKVDESGVITVIGGNCLKDRQQCQMYIEQVIDNALADEEERKMREAEILQKRRESAERKERQSEVERKLREELQEVERQEKLRREQEQLEREEEERRRREDRERQREREDHERHRIESAEILRQQQEEEERRRQEVLQQQRIAMQQENSSRASKSSSLLHNGRTNSRPSSSAVAPAAGGTTTTLPSRNSQLPAQLFGDHSVDHVLGQQQATTSNSTTNNKLKIDCPKDKHAVIIGKQGKMMKQLKQHFQVTEIKLREKQQTCEISGGTEEARLECATAIQELVLTGTSAFLNKRETAAQPPPAQPQTSKFAPNYPQQVGGATSGHIVQPESHVNQRQMTTSTQQFLLPQQTNPPLGAAAAGSTNTDREEEYDFAYDAKANFDSKSLDPDKQIREDWKLDLEMNLASLVEGETYSVFTDDVEKKGSRQLLFEMCKAFDCDLDIDEENGVYEFVKA
ncbi:unnamed protein product [Amoebophrya sp. A120]|nr:unnamed protein product [Amoebophrya sp. A120]|eukprot:GSA120T00001081001.1